MRYFPCAYLGTEIELTAEREQHIIETHPGTLPDYLEPLAETLADPDQICQSDRDQSALLSSKWFATIRTGRYLVVVIVSQTEPNRHWIVTTYIARKLAEGKVIWTKT